MYSQSRVTSLQSEAVLTCTHNQCFSKNTEKIKKFHIFFLFHFLSPNDSCALNGRVFLHDYLVCFPCLRSLLWLSPNPGEYLWPSSH